MSPARLTVVGDALLDRDVMGTATRLCPDAPAPVVSDPETRERPGGAGLAAALLARDGHRVTLVTALGHDAAGARLADLLARRGVDVVDVGGGGETPVKERLLADGHVLARVDRGEAGVRVDAWRPDVAAAITGAAAVLVSDYGRAVAGDLRLRRLLAAVDAPVVWDPHPRGAPPVPGACLVTPNRAEAEALSPGDEPEAVAVRLLAVLDARAVAVTLGAAGAVVAEPGSPPARVPAPVVRAGDPCGAGDRLASAAAAALAEGADAVEAVRRGVAAASAFVAAGGAGGLDAPPPAEQGDADAVVAAARAAGATVVATGGCFDLLHAGHLATLEAARALGDVLVVLLNSDASVARLKGPDRPLVHEDDRAALLRGLRAVDAVTVFGEDTPVEALRRLRPDVFAKGGDYAAGDLPEAPVMRALGGRVVTLPFLAGRSTTRLIAEAVGRTG